MRQVLREIAMSVEAKRMLRPACLTGLLLSCLFSSLSQAQVSLVRLTPEQYQRTIHDVFGDSIQVEKNRKGVFAPREQGLLALANRKLTVDVDELEQDEAIAQKIAAQVVDAPHRSALLGCEPRAEDQPDDGCAERFIARIGLLLFRRPLSATELRSLVGLQNRSAQRLHSFNAGLANALERMLMAPEFLFRVETGTPDPMQPGTLQLDAYTRASRLSYFLWDSEPDRELLTAAQSGQLMSAQGLQQQVERLLRSPRAEYGLRAFFTDMLQLSDIDHDRAFALAIDTGAHPDFIAAVQADAQEQTLRTIVDQLLSRNVDYRDLFITRDTFLTPALATIYGVQFSGPRDASGEHPWVAYRYAESDPYVGILSHISFLARHSREGETSPTRRGKAVREIFLCGRVPPPPGNVDFDMDPRYRTVRQRLAAHLSEPICAGCHKLTDPVGLALENFDIAGTPRAMENGVPIEASGELNGRSFAGFKQLAQVIRDDPATTACLISRAYSYGTEREPTEKERLWLDRLQAQLWRDGVRWLDLMRRITLDPDFYSMPVSSVPEVNSK
jgi:hypothetical protein